METLGERIERARLAAGIERKALARRGRITEAHLSQIVHGRREPSYKVLRRISDALDVSLDWLAYGRGEMRRPRWWTSVPLVGSVPAHERLPAPEDVHDTVRVPEEVERQRPDFAVVVREAGEEYQPGEVLFVRRQETAEPGDVVLAEVPEDDAQVVTLKRWRRGDGYAVLEPGGVEYRPLVSRGVKVIGKVVGRKTL